eukprot:CAMPEP_0115849588 /NCGR_PEP_ID=MMETSP0287-20121206/11528_1 /TAXON_ID=412157 /ORGANISM="Chrysochromulina rotalis, Strain UIO044" /LENGTH=253 /DNA_ID=CAMNT_0003303563 /DNA_START=79 /DNA_END=840 /DNA_ORIENTATION=+
MERATADIEEGGSTGTSSALLPSDAARKEADDARKQLTFGLVWLKVICSASCVGLIVVDVFEVMTEASDFEWYKFISTVYNMIFACIGVVVEGSPVFCTRWFREAILMWIRLLSRVFGRGLLYLLIGGMHLAAQDNLWGIISGCVMLGCGILSLICSRLVRRRLQTLHERIVANHTHDRATIKIAFDAQDVDGKGELSATSLAAVARALGSKLRDDEVAGIMHLLDRESTGQIPFAVFVGWWTGDTAVDFTVV